MTALPHYSGPWTLSSADNQAWLQIAERRVAEIIGRPEFRVEVLARYNPDQVCVLMRRDRGRGNSPRMEGAAVVLQMDELFDHEPADVLPQLVGVAARRLAVAAPIPYAEHQEVPWLEEVE